MKIGKILLKTETTLYGSTVLVLPHHTVLLLVNRNQLFYSYKQYLNNIMRNIIQKSTAEMSRHSKLVLQLVLIFLKAFTSILAISTKEKTQFGHLILIPSSFHT